jgi:hypothetical protein
MNHNPFKSDQIFTLKICATLFISRKMSHVTGYAAFNAFVAENTGKDIFALFCGGKDESGNSWCSDCVVAEPVSITCVFDSIKNMPKRQ